MAQDEINHVEIRAAMNENIAAATGQDRPMPGDTVAIKESISLSQRLRERAV